MKVVIDSELQTVTETTGQGERVVKLYSPEGFGIVNREWLRVGFAQKYCYQFKWFGRPVIQLPEDMVRIQEIIYSLKPDVVLETGIAHGGSLIFYASLLKAIGRGRVIGVDIEIRQHNRDALDEHEFRDMLTMIEGSSVDPVTVAAVKSHIQPGETVLLLLDSNHSKQHVLDELRAYASLVPLGSYAVATDGIMELVADGPMAKSDWALNNPKAAAAAFLLEDDRFEMEEPPITFNESRVSDRTTYWPSAYLKRVA